MFAVTPSPPWRDAIARQLWQLAPDDEARQAALAANIEAALVGDAHEAVWCFGGKLRR